MSLIKSVSGIRGTIGGLPGDNLTPPDIIAFVAAYGNWLYKDFQRPAVVIGRDGRISGAVVKNIVAGTLQMMGIDVIDLDYSTTPSVEMHVINTGSSGGIIITASHNPAEWNALKFLNHKGEFISSEAGEEIKLMAESGSLNSKYSSVDGLGTVTLNHDAIEKHVDAILKHELIDADKIRSASLHAVVDCINSTGNISIPVLLQKLGVTYKLLNDGEYGRFAHNPEPLPEHLKELCAQVISENADLGIAVDPDVDRLALVAEDGIFFGEEYTLVCAADYVLGHKLGSLVTNLSSSRALKDLAASRGVECYYAPVGEVHVVNEMKMRNAILGGEGNGGVIDPALHYGRDSLMGIALILMHLATCGKTLSQLKAGYPQYVMIKDKINFDPKMSATDLLNKVAIHYQSEKIDNRDGLKIDFEESWIHLRRSNTEPILRIYAEAKDLDTAEKIIGELKGLLH